MAIRRFSTYARHWTLAVAFIGGVISTLAVSHPASQAVLPHSSTIPIAATVDGHPITLQEVESAAALSLYQLDHQRHHLLLQALQQNIDEELLRAEAARTGVTVQKLLTEASQSKPIARLANLPAPLRRLPSDAAPNGTTFQDQKEAARIRQAMVVSLRRQADVRVTLPDPDPPILPVTSGNAPSLGSRTAPITIVEFSDFQCPYCQKSAAVLKELRRLYGETLRVVYRDFPGPNHPFAQEAAEAAQCAGDQGLFWEYHDKLFDRQTGGTDWNHAEIARELGLQSDEFSTCLTTGRHREEVHKDLRDGLALGLTSTPTFFINGRPLVGARPAADFTAIIDPLLHH